MNVEISIVCLFLSAANDDNDGVDMVHHNGSQVHRQPDDLSLFRGMLHFYSFFRSTSKSRPNNIRGGKNVRPYVRPSTKSFFDFNEIWYIGRGR